MTENELLLALDVVTEGAGAQAPRAIASEAFSTEGFRRQTERIQQRSLSWTAGPGIQGVGIGNKITKGAETEELSLRVYVDEKRPTSGLSNPVPKQVAIPEVGKAPTDVIAIGQLERETFTERARPAMPGCGVGHPDVTVGTFGCLVRKRGKKRGLYILSNSHVLADEGVAHVGDDTLQPGDFDGGGLPADRIGELADFVPFEFTDTGFPNLVDAAIAKVDKSRDVTRIIRLLGIEPVGVGRTVRRGMVVRKVGRTTDFTTGVIQDVHFRFSLKYKKPGHRSAHYRRRGHRRVGRVGFRNQVLCSRYTAGGDSGSAVLNSRGRVVGLHFAGSPSSSVFNRITHVFRLLDVELP